MYMYMHFSVAISCLKSVKAIMLFVLACFHIAALAAAFHIAALAAAEAPAQLTPVPAAAEAPAQLAPYLAPAQLAPVPAAAASAQLTPVPAAAEASAKLAPYHFAQAAAAVIMDHLMELRARLPLSKGWGHFEILILALQWAI